MRSIAISAEQPLIYEGEGGYGHGLWPAPVFTVATVLLKPEDVENIPSTMNLHVNPLLFREDSFDPVTRIRRGRLYKSPGAQPQQWRVQPHPAYSEEVGFHRDSAGWLQKSLHGFYAWSAWAEVPKDARNTMLALGTQEAYTLWKIVNIERIVSREDLLTLRAHGALGILAELREAIIPDDARAKLVEVFTKLSDVAYRAGPESVIDRARDLAQWSLGVWLAAEKNDPKFRHDDLGELANKIPEEKKVLKNIAQTLARLHARAKPNEQARYGVRPLVEADAEFALAAVGTLLRELDWAV